MSTQNLSRLSDISEEKSASVSVDSLENADDIAKESFRGKDTAHGLNCSLESNEVSPSFHSVPSSSHCEASLVSESITVCNTKTNHLRTIATEIKNDALEVHQKPCSIRRCIEPSEKDKVKTGLPEKNNDAVENQPSDTSSTRKYTAKPSSNTMSESEPQSIKSKAGVEQQSWIPIAVRSLPVIARLRQSIEKHLHRGHSETHGAVSGAEFPASSLSSLLDPTPKAAERCRSHHTIERPRKDFIQLNKQGEFRRTKTYHTLHLARRDADKTADSSAVSSSEITNSATADVFTASTCQKNTSAAGLSHPPRHPTSPRGQPPGDGSSPRSTDPDSLAADSEGSGGRRGSRIPVRSGRSATPRRPHRSRESRRNQEDRASRHEGHVSRQNPSVSHWEMNDGRLEFHESRLSYDSLENELTVSNLRLSHLRLSQIDVNDNRRLISDVSAPSLLDHQCHGHSRSKDLVLLEDNTSSLSLQLADSRKVYTPPERIPMPYRHVEYQPNLKPYPRQYINLGKLGPDPTAVRARQEKMQKQQEYAEQVAKKNRSSVKQRSDQYSKQQGEQTQSSHDKMADYARTVPKPKQKPKQQHTASSKESREVSPMSNIRKLLAEGDQPDPRTPSRKSPRRSNIVSPTRRSVSSSDPRKCTPPAKVPSAKPLPAKRQPVARQHSISVPEPRPPPIPLPTFDAPKTSALPPKDNRRRPRHQSGRSTSVEQARVVSSLTRLRSLAEQLVTGSPVTPNADGVPRRLHRDDSCPTLGASSDMDSDFSTDSLIAATRPTAVSMGRRHGSTSQRGRGMFPPARETPNCRRPTIRCSRGVGPDRPGAASRPVSEDFFYDTCGGHGECACGDDSCSPPHRRPAVTRGTQSKPMLNETFLVHKNPLVVDIGLPVGTGRARRFSSRPRLGDLSPDSLVGSPPKDSRKDQLGGLPFHASTLQMMRERHLRDKRRVDAIIAGSSTRM